MGSVRKIHIDESELLELYVHKEMSIPQVSLLIKVTKSTVRLRLIEMGILRSHSDAIRLAAKKGRLSSGRGRQRLISPEWRNNIRLARLAYAEKNARGFSIKSNGYVEYTRGPNKGRSFHVVAIENLIGRKIHPDEVVHHKDHDKQNNDLSNLELMSRSSHTSLHSKENFINRKRDSYGKFE